MAWYNSAWGYRVAITVAHGKVGSSLTDFPVYVDLANLPSGFFSHVRADGGDIRVTQSDGVTECPRQIVTITTGSSIGEMHFKANSLSSTADTVYYIYYGNASATEPAANSTYGSQNVWTNSYLAVWHMQEDPGGTAPQFKDSTSHGRDLTSNGSMTAASNTVAGKLDGNGVFFNGTTQFLRRTSENMGAPSTITIQGWCDKTTDTGQSELLSIKDTVAMRINAPGFWFFYYDGAGWQNSSYAPSVELAWHLFHYTVTAGSQLSYLDGSSVVSNTDANAINWIGDSNTDTTVGVHAAGTSYFLPGKVDELRVSGVVRTGQWISTEYNNQSSPSTFYSVGSETLKLPPVGSEVMVKQAVNRSYTY